MGDRSLGDPQGGLLSDAGLRLDLDGAPVVWVGGLRPALRCRPLSRVDRK